MVFIILLTSQTLGALIAEAFNADALVLQVVAKPFNVSEGAQDTALVRT